MKSSSSIPPPPKIHANTDFSPVPVGEKHPVLDSAPAGEKHPVLDSAPAGEKHIVLDNVSYPCRYALIQFVMKFSLAGVSRSPSFFNAVFKIFKQGAPHFSKYDCLQRILRTLEPHF